MCALTKGIFQENRYKSERNIGFTNWQKEINPILALQSVLCTEEENYLALKYSATFSAIDCGSLPFSANSRTEARAMFFTDPNVWSN